MSGRLFTASVYPDSAGLRNYPTLSADRTAYVVVRRDFGTDIDRLFSTVNLLRRLRPKHEQLLSVLLTLKLLIGCTVFNDESS